MKSKSKEYAAWSKMKQRCQNPNATGFHCYGGRGIRVCHRWLKSFDAFLRDVGVAPSPTHSIDRFPDNNGDYKPGNVRWATARQQRKNQRTEFETGAIVLPPEDLVDAVKKLALVSSDPVIAKHLGVAITTVMNLRYGWPVRKKTLALAIRRLKSIGTLPGARPGYLSSRERALRPPLTISMDAGPSKAIAGTGESE